MSSSFTTAASLALPLMSLVSVCLLLYSKADRQRVVALWSFALVFVIFGLMYAIINHAVNSEPGRTSNTFLRGFAGAELHWFYGNSEAFVVYALVMAALCYAANQHVSQRLKRERAELR